MKLLISLLMIFTILVCNHSYGEQSEINNPKNKTETEKINHNHHQSLPTQDSSPSLKSPKKQQEQLNITQHNTDSNSDIIESDIQQTNIEDSIDSTRTQNRSSDQLSNQKLVDDYNNQTDTTSSVSSSSSSSSSSAINNIIPKPINTTSTNTPLASDTPNTPTINITNIDEVKDHYTLAMQLYDLERWQIALDYLHAISIKLSTHPHYILSVDQAVLFYNLGNLYYYNDKPIKAIAAYLKASKYSLNKKDIMNNLTKITHTLEIELDKSFFQLVDTWCLEIYYYLLLTLSILLLFLIILIFWFKFIKGKFLTTKVTIGFTAIVIILIGVCGYKYYQILSFNKKFVLAVNSTTSSIYSSSDSSKVVLDYLTAGSIVTYDPSTTISVKSHTLPPKPFSHSQTSDQDQLVKVTILTQRKSTQQSIALNNAQTPKDKKNSSIEKNHTLQLAKHHQQLSQGWVLKSTLISWDKHHTNPQAKNF